MPRATALPSSCSTTSMAEVAVVALMPVEKPVDVPATAPGNKKPSSSSSAKKRKGRPPDLVPATEAPVAKRKGKGPPNLAPAAEAPVAKKPKTGDARTPTAEPPRSGVAVAHTAVQTLASASSAALAMPYGLPAPMSTLPVLHDANADGQTPQQEEGRINDGGWQTVGEKKHHGRPHQVMACVEVEVNFVMAGG